MSAPPSQPWTVVVQQGAQFISTGLQAFLVLGMIMTAFVTLAGLGLIAAQHHAGIFVVPVGAALMIGILWRHVSLQHRAAGVTSLVDLLTQGTPAVNLSDQPSWYSQCASVLPEAGARHRVFQSALGFVQKQGLEDAVEHRPQLVEHMRKDTTLKEVDAKAVEGIAGLLHDLLCATAVQGKDPSVKAWADEVSTVHKEFEQRERRVWTQRTARLLSQSVSVFGPKPVAMVSSLVMGDDARPVLAECCILQMLTGMVASEVSRLAYGGALLFIVIGGLLGGVGYMSQSSTTTIARLLMMMAWAAASTLIMLGLCTLCFAGMVLGFLRDKLTEAVDTVAKSMRLTDHEKKCLSMLRLSAR